MSWLLRAYSLSIIQMDDGRGRDKEQKWGGTARELGIDLMSHMRRSRRQEKAEPVARCSFHSPRMLSNGLIHSVINS